MMGVSALSLRAAALSDNALTPIIAKSFQLSETVNAHQSVEEGSIIGNVVINI